MLSLTLRLNRLWKEKRTTDRKKKFTKRKSREETYIEVIARWLKSNSHWLHSVMSYHYTCIRESKCDNIAGFLETAQWCIKVDMHQSAKTCFKTPPVCVVLYDVVHFPDMWPLLVVYWPKQHNLGRRLGWMGHTWDLFYLPWIYYFSIHHQVILVN